MPSSVVPVYLAELAPFEIRGWVSGRNEVAIVSGQLAAFGITGGFFLFAGVGAVALVFEITQVPETRGITLEKLEEGVHSGAVYDFRAARAERDAGIATAGRY